MDVIKANEMAHALYRAHGDKAELEAAQREHQFSNDGDEDQAIYWRTIRASIRQLRGANQG